MALNHIYDFLEDSPDYPNDFYPTLDGTQSFKVKNQFLWAELQAIESGEWRKVYQDRYSEDKFISVPDGVTCRLQR